MNRLERRVVAAAVALGGLIPGVVGVAAPAARAVPLAPGQYCSAGSLPITGVATSEKVITFTFDDGPSSNDERVMKIFEDRGLTATFFLIGVNVRKPGGDAMVRSMVARGFEVGLHGVTHHYDAPRNLAELEPGIEQLQAVTGVRPRFYRAPGLNWSKRVLDALGPLGLCPISQLLFVDDHLMPRKDAATLCAAFHRRLAPGRIVILHPEGATHLATLRALPCMVDDALRRGYRIVGLREFLDLAGGDPAGYSYRPVTKR